MKFKLVLIILVTIQIRLFSQDDREIKYIINYSKLAVSEMNQYKIPASIKLAQGIIETGGGQSKLAEKANNHFGIKCKAEWKGETIYHDDDAPGECFRKYNTVEESFRDHSKFLTERPYYKSLFNLPLVDYKAWSIGLKTTGYATNPNYSQMLISKIEKYKLHEFDVPSNSSLEIKLVELFPQYINDIFKDKNYEIPKIEEKKIPNSLVLDVPIKANEVEKPDPKTRILFHKNGLKYVILQKGESVTNIGALFKIPEKDLLNFNDLMFSSFAKEEQFIFLEKKKNTGFDSFYTVEKGDSMYKISQKLGIDLYYLYYFNSMKHTQEPIEGQVLALKYLK